MRKIKKIILENNNFLVLSHKNVEADALGSSLAFYYLLKKMNKKAWILNEDTIPSSYNFLPGIKKISKNISKIDAPICFVLDCSDVDRLGKTKRFLKGRKVVNIDHHISNTRFGDVNWVDSESSSTCEMVYRLYRYLNVKLDKKIALCLYSGIVADTGSFSFGNTTSSTHKVIAELLKFNLPVNEIYQHIYHSFSFKEVLFSIRALSNIKLLKNGKIVYCIVDKTKPYKKDGSDTTEFMFSIMRAIKSVEVAILFKILDSDKVHVSFRSKRNIDVNKIASLFGGGGHLRASAVMMNMNINKAKNKVLKAVKRCF